jgi:hypothetical protein
MATITTKDGSSSKTQHSGSVRACRTASPRLSAIELNTELPTFIKE